MNDPHVTDSHSDVSETVSGINRRRALKVAGAAMVAGFSGITLSTPALARQNHSSTDAALLTTVYASDYGFDPLDSTQAILDALASGADRVVIDNVGSEWLVRPLVLTRDNVEIVLESGVTVRAKPGAFPNLGDKLLYLLGRSNVTISGYGATLAMNKAEYTSGQWRAAIVIASCQDITVEGVTITGAGGDGVYIGRATTNPANYPAHSSNITVRNVRCYNNARNGMSVISVDGLLVEKCAFVNTSGQNPQAGLDFEPNSADERLTNIIIRDCVMENNVNYGVVLGLQTGMSGAPTPLSILLDRIRVGSQVNDQPSFLHYGPATGHPGGSVEVRDSFIQTSPYSTSLAAYQKDAAAASLTFTRTAVLNWGNQDGLYEPITLLGIAEEDYGGVTWTDCSLITNQPGPFLAVHKENAAGAGVRALHGNITVVNPNGATMSLGVDPTDVTLAVRALTSVPATTVGITAVDTTVNAGDLITLTFSRTSADLVAPLAVRYSLSGTAVERVDIDGITGMVIIPPGATTVQSTILARPQSGISGTRTATFTLTPTLGYSIGSASGVTVTITL